MRKHTMIPLILAMVVCGTITLVWPGDSIWLGDEPVLLQMAWRHLQHGTIAKYGLVGSKGTYYGPLPVWIYQLMLRGSQDLITLSLARGILVTSVTASALWVLATECRYLWPSVAALALLSPYFWIYSHQLWDNSFLVPLTAATWASYVSFCRKPRAAALFAVVLFSCGMFLAHLMAVSILLPLLVHALAFHRGWLRRNIISLSIPLAIAGLASAYYLRHLFASIVRLLGNHSAAPSLSVFSGWWFPLQGGQFFAATGLEYFFGDQWWQGNAVVHASAVITSMALVLMWAGALAALWRCRPSSTASPLERQVNTLAVGTLVFACFFHGVMRAYGEPHYFNALWIVCFYLIWLLLTIFYEKNPWLGRCVVGLQAVSMAVVLLYLVRTVHLSAGTREPRFGTTLSHQIEIARELTRYHAVNQPHDPVQPGQCEFEPPLRYLSFQVIQEIYGLKASPTAPALPGIWVGYRTKNSSDGWLVIETKPSM